MFGLRAPEEIEGFTLNDSTNFEKVKPGDGYGLDYSQSGWKLDVFVYDLKRAAIPEDVKTAIVKAEFERSRAEAFLAQPRGLYAQVYLRRNFTIDDPAHRTRFQCAAFHLTRDGAKPQDGYLCLTSWNNKFVKFRLTTLADTNTEDAARKYVAAWMPVLWGGGGAPYRAETSRAEPVPVEPSLPAYRPGRRPRPAPPTSRAEQIPTNRRRRCGVRPPGPICIRSTQSIGRRPGRGSSARRNTSAKRSNQAASDGPGVCRIAATASPILSGSVTGSEQVSPTQTNAALPAAAIFDCAGWPAGRSLAEAARSRMRLTNGSFSAASANRDACGPVTTISAALSRRSSAFSRAACWNRLSAAPASTPSNSASACARHFASPVSAASRTRFCAAIEFGLGVASSLVEAGRTTSPSASAAVRK